MRNSLQASAGFCVDQMVACAFNLFSAIATKPPDDTAIFVSFSRRVEGNQASEPLSLNVFGVVFAGRLFL
jgi:hypothetical protein